MHTLPDLAYDYSVFEPYIDGRTMEIHHTKHHGNYVNNLNNVLDMAGSKFFEMPIEELLVKLSHIPEGQRALVRNNGGGHFNHSLYWKMLSPTTKKIPDELNRAIKSNFGSVSAFKDEFTRTALARFGSGWTWLSVYDGSLVITSTPNNDNPIMDGSGKPIACMDVWEHAYYLKYQNRRPDYIQSWWNVVNWEEVGNLYNQFK